MIPPHDETLDTLLSLDGTIFVIEPKHGFWVKFIVKRTEVTDEKPHGISYSLTLHNNKNERVVGFDNAHSVGGKSKAFDHKHRLRTIRPNEYKYAASLLSDFWNEVDAVLKELGVKI